MNAVKNSGQTRFTYGARSFDVPPPGGESLKNTAERVLALLLQKIEPMLRDGKNILIVAHGNRLKSAHNAPRKDVR